MCEHQHYSFLKFEVERLRKENEELCQERKRIWEQAERAIRIQHKLEDLFDEFTMIKEPVASGQ
jgi:uncharacterized protein YigA (DUF484 family)